VPSSHSGHGRKNVEAKILVFVLLFWRMGHGIVLSFCEEKKAVFSLLLSSITGPGLFLFLKTDILAVE
jgi:hypothetical protein